MAALGVFQRRTEISDAPGIAALIDAGSRTQELFGDINIVTAMYAPTNTKALVVCPPSTLSCPPRALLDASRPLGLCRGGYRGVALGVASGTSWLLSGPCNWRCSGHGRVWPKGSAVVSSILAHRAHSAKRADRHQLSRPGVRLQAPACTADASTGQYTAVGGGHGGEHARGWQHCRHSNGQLHVSSFTHPRFLTAPAPICSLCIPDYTLCSTHPATLPPRSEKAVLGITAVDVHGNVVGHASFSDSPPFPGVAATK